MKKVLVAVIGPLLVILFILKPIPPVYGACLGSCTDWLNAPGNCAQNNNENDCNNSRCLWNKPGVCRHNQYGDNSCSNGTCLDGCNQRISCSSGTGIAPPPKPAGTGTIQGCKVLGFAQDCSNPAFNPKIITLDGRTTESQLGNSSKSSYSFPNISAGSHTVAVPSAPAGYTISGYSLCYNQIGCHTSLVGPGNSVTVNVPANGYADLWWHFMANSGGVASCSVSGPATAVVGRATSGYGFTYSNAANGQLYWGPTSSASWTTMCNYNKSGGCANQSITFPKAGAYWVICDARTNANTGCTGNPFVGYPYTSLDGTIYQNCGSKSRIQVSVSTRPGDFNNDGKVDIRDFDFLMSSYTSSRIYDYNNMVANYGK
ncbi:hypothetical protein M1403_03780 [Patescibacteria group bacterium]|nr:hypothetical protein [Patescibacteria group bacterium]